MTVKADGRLVSWTITLAKPGKDQIKFFDQKLGGESQAQVTVLRPGNKLYARVIAHGPLVKLKPYFGRRSSSRSSARSRSRRAWSSV